MGKPKREKPNRQDRASRKPKAEPKRRKTIPAPGPMELTFTGRGLQVTDEMREAATHKLGRLQRLEPRAVRLDLEIISENHPKPDGLRRIEAELHTPRKTFRARAEAPERSRSYSARSVPTCDSQLYRSRAAARQPDRRAARSSGAGRLAVCCGWLRWAGVGGGNYGTQYRICHSTCCSRPVRWYIKR
jgi:ribosome-associated translation inhibitor RaiA